MSTTLIEVRPAKAADAAAVASTHDEAWRSAYQGIIPGAELEKLINRRGPQWWDSAIRKGSRVSVLVFGDRPQPRAQPAFRRRDLRALSAAGVSGPRLRPPAVHRRTTRPVAERPEKYGDLGALRQRSRDGVLPRARRPDGRAQFGEIRAQVARQGRFRLDQLGASRLRRAWRRTETGSIRAAAIQDLTPKPS